MTEVAEADVFLMGHDHKKGLATKTKLVLTGNGDKIKLNHKKILFGRTGSFLIGYRDNVVSYVSAKVLATYRPWCSPYLHETKVRNNTREQ
jgi:hypothetical protein